MRAQMADVRISKPCFLAKAQLVFLRFRLYRPTINRTQSAFSRPFSNPLPWKQPIQEYQKYPAESMTITQVRVTFFPFLLSICHTYLCMRCNFDRECISKSNDSDARFYPLTHSFPTERRNRAAPYMCL